MIKVVRPCHVNVVPGCHFSTLIQARDTEHHDRNFLSQSSALAYSRSDWKYLNNIKSKTDEYQIRMVKSGF